MICFQCLMVILDRFLWCHLKCIVWVLSLFFGKHRCSDMARLYAIRAPAPRWAPLTISVWWRGRLCEVFSDFPFSVITIYRMIYFLRNSYTTFPNFPSRQMCPQHNVLPPLEKVEMRGKAQRVVLSVPAKSRGYCSEVHHIFIGRRMIIVSFNACILVAIFPSTVECQRTEWRWGWGMPIFADLRKNIGYYSNVPWATAKIESDWSCRHMCSTQPGNVWRSV